MLEPVLSLWLGSNQPGFFLGSSCLVSTMLVLWLGGIQTSLSLGPGGEFPGFTGLSLYALSHDELPALLYNLLLVLVLGPCQERRWGTISLLLLSILSMVLLPPLYTLLLFIGSGETSRISGFSGVQLALFTAQCRQVKQRKIMRCIPVWFLPWLLLLFNLLLLPNTPPLLHFCAICIGHNYRQSFVAELQGCVATTRRFHVLPEWLYIPSSSRMRLPTHGPSYRSGSLPLLDPRGRLNLPRRPSMEEPPLLNPQPWAGQGPHWLLDGSATASEAQQLEEQMLRAGIQASLQGAPEGPDTKVEVPKSSVSSIRLQQLEKMGFPTEKAVLALAASKQLDGAISLLIDDRVGEEAVVTSKGKNFLPPHQT